MEINAIYKYPELEELTVNDRKLMDSLFMKEKPLTIIKSSKGELISFAILNNIGYRIMYVGLYPYEFTYYKIGFIYTIEKHRRKGYALNILKSIEGKSVKLLANPIDEISINLFEKSGFKYHQELSSYCK